MMGYFLVQVNSTAKAYKAVDFPTLLAPVNTIAGHLSSKESENKS